MPYIDLHTHRSPENIGSLYIRNENPVDELYALKPGGFYSVGIHPWDISDYNGDGSAAVSGNSNRIKIQQLEKLVERPDVIAVGECGLDKMSKVDFHSQFEMFIRQCEIAETVKKPVIIHCVKAYNEICHLKRKMKPNVPWIFHGYAASEMITRQLIDQGFYFSLGKLIFNEQAHVKKSLALIPINRIFFETDEWIEPVSKVYIQAGTLLNLPVENLLDQVMWNFREVFIGE